MNIQEIIKQKDWWYLQYYDYHMDSDWVHQYLEPAPYPAFKWLDDYRFRTLRLYFRIAIREHVKEKFFRENKYTVIIGGAISEVPLPIEIWEQVGDPWKSGTSVYIDCFYFGHKYKELEKSYIGEERPGIYSFLIKGFNNSDEAKQFAEMWKLKAIEDHIEDIKIDKEIIKLLK